MKMGIIERIKGASSEAQVKTLIEKAASFSDISKKTMRKAVRTAKNTIANLSAKSAK
jgi:hypothetical protein